MTFRWRRFLVSRSRQSLRPLFEAANLRHRHESAVWRYTAIPENEILIPGCIDLT